MYRQQRVYNKYQRIGKSTIFRTIHFFTLNRTNQILQQNFHELVCQKLTKKLTKKSDLQKNYTRLLVWFSVALDFWETLN